MENERVRIVREIARLEREIMANRYQVRLLKYSLKTLDMKEQLVSGKVFEDTK